jgi:hypothetical protein
MNAIFSQEDHSEPKLFMSFFRLFVTQIFYGTVFGTKFVTVLASQPKITEEVHPCGSQLCEILPFNSDFFFLLNIFFMMIFPKSWHIERCPVFFII